ncbi:MAG: lipopolysaccharide kinase InaA family protein [Verrucomicrobiae bacterium]|nr:lipopolysaccharide kinase InaA family protein [Verrucomicrobiae bacterium]
MSSGEPEQIIRFSAGRHRWRVLAGERAYLFSRERSGQIRQAPMTRIKQSRAKVVYRMKLDGPSGPRSVYLKSYLMRHYFWRPLKYLFRTSPAMAEWRLAQELAQRGVPIARHLAVGETRYRGLLLEATLVTEGLTGFDDIEGVVQKQYGGCIGAAPAPLRRRFARELGKFVRLLHDRGVLQVDLHPANIMVRVGHNGVPEFRLVDLDGIELHRRLSRSQRMANLVTLNNYFGPRTNRTDRLRFLRAYLGDDNATRLPQLAREIERDSEQALKQYRRARAERCLKSNRDFAIRRAGGLTWHVRRSALNCGLETVLESADRLVEQRGAQIKDSRSATIARAQGYFIKRTNPGKLANWFKDIFRPSRAQQAFLRAYHLELCGIPTPTAVACGDLRTLGFLHHSYLVTVDVPLALDLSQIVLRKVPLTLTERRRMLRDLAQLIAKLHDCGFSHRDLKVQNILAGPPPRRPLYLIDLDGLSDVDRVTPQRARKDLARLDRGAREVLLAGPRERLRFFVEYRRALRDRRLRAAFGS